MITEEQYLEADIWLAEQVGECVHDWQNTVYNEGWVWVCMKCDTTKTIHAKYSYANMMKVYPVDFPRSKDLGAMVNVALSLKQDMTISPLHDAVNNPENDKPGCVEVWNRYDKDNILGVRFQDHPTPQHAAAWALYLALREVKK